jgi:hypothetical protein
MTEPIAPRDAAMAAALALASALVLGVVLATIDTPKDFSKRLVAVEQQSDQARGMLRAKGTNTFSPDAVCAHPAEAERFQASGSYESALMAMDQLAKRRPQVFADTVDLTSKTSSVTLVFSGRVFCSV